MRPEHGFPHDFAIVEGVTDSECERPHEVLGLRFGQVDPVVIVAAALAKLRLIRAANGSEIAVRRAVEAAIVRARDCLLAEAYGRWNGDAWAARGTLAVGRGEGGSVATACEGGVHRN